MAFKITEDCIQCGACESECADGAISFTDGTYVINADTCTECGTCFDTCPNEAILKP